MNMETSIKVNTTAFADGILQPRTESNPPQQRAVLEHRLPSLQVLMRLLAEHFLPKGPNSARTTKPSMKIATTPADSDTHALSPREVCTNER